MKSSSSDELSDSSEPVISELSDDLICSEITQTERIESAHFLDIMWAEEQIDQDQPLYLMTFNPVPDETPDCAFIDQHCWWVGLMAAYCKSCDAACFCVEATQRGYPHYHGWYQPSEDPKMEMMRICNIKIMLKFAPAGVKIDLCQNMIQINNWSNSNSNALYYYKKNLPTTMFYMPLNPITNLTPLNPVSVDDYKFFFMNKGRNRVADIIERKNKIHSARLFYEKSFREN